MRRPVTLFSNFSSVPPPPFSGAGKIKLNNLCIKALCLRQVYSLHSIIHLPLHFIPRTVSLFHSFHFTSLNLPANANSLQSQVHPTAKAGPLIRYTKSITSHFRYLGIIRAFSVKDKMPQVFNLILQNILYKY